jgi:hypothetical protein
MKRIIALSVLTLAALGALDLQRASASPVAFGPCGDVTIGSANVPRDTVDTLTTFRMNVGLGNRGTKADSGRVSIVIADTAAFRVVYAESVFFRIGGGTAQRVDFPETRFTTLGPHHGLVRLWTYRGSKDSLKWDFWVVTGLGVEESHQPQAASPKLAATVVRGVLVLSQASSRKPPATSLLDVSGRKVQDLHPGANDVRALAPGVYFVREAQAQAVRKVIISN